VVGRRNQRKILHVGVIVRIGRLGSWRLILSYAVQVDNAVAKMDMVARYPDNPFDEVDVSSVGLLNRLVENDDVSAFDFAIGQKRRPLRPGSQDGDGITKFWKMNVSTNRPMATMLQMDAKPSRAVSRD
jgi:hypothetical protein